MANIQDILRDMHFTHNIGITKANSSKTVLGKLLTLPKVREDMRYALWDAQFTAGASNGYFYERLDRTPVSRIRYWADQLIRARPNKGSASGDLKEVASKVTRFVPLSAMVIADKKGYPLISRKQLCEILIHAMSISDVHGEQDEQKTHVTCPMNPRTGYPFVRCARYRRVDGMGVWMRHLARDIGNSDVRRDGILLTVEQAAGLRWCETRIGHGDCACAQRAEDPAFVGEALALKKSGSTAPFPCWYSPCELGINVGENITFGKCSKRSFDVA